MKKNRYVISAYEVRELMEAYDENAELVLDAAIEIARERARLYVMPARWEAKYNNDGSITVIRYHN